MDSIWGSYRRLNNITGWILFVISFSVYLLTLEPTVSFWDCGEFILSSYKLQVGHPPGAPLFIMIGRIATLFAFGDTSKVALMMNGLSDSMPSPHWLPGWFSGLCSNGRKRLTNRMPADG